jgi:tRNA threonylcarbamoyl adenosine modification protein YeaZ
MIAGYALGLDTSGPVTSLAIARLTPEVQVLDEIEGQPEASQSELLDGLLKLLLARSKLTLRELDALIVGAGPGSFTGLRAGYAFLKGVALGLALPLFEVSSLKACALAAGADADLVFAVADARRGEVFCEGYLSASAGPILATQILSYEALFRAVGELGRLYGVSEHRTVIASTSGRFFDGPPVKQVFPRGLAAGLLRAAAADVAAAPGTAPSVAALAASQPNYVRRAAAKTIAERLQENAGAERGNLEAETVVKSRHGGD